VCPAVKFTEFRLFDRINVPKTWMRGKSNIAQWTDMNQANVIKTQNRFGQDVDAFPANPTADEQDRRFYSGRYGLSRKHGEIHAIGIFE